MKTASLDYLNIGLMILSLLTAFAVPFELFLFSYAVLGPLHYFTEIGWLHTKNYYTSGKYDYLFLVSFAAASLAGHFVPAMQYVQPTIIYSAFLASLALIVIRSVSLKIFAVVAISFISLLLLNNLFYLAIFIPSIIHVYFFTGAFMLFGALRNRSIPGLLSVAVLLLSAVLCFVLVPERSSVVSEYIRVSYGYFETLHFSIAKFLRFESLADSGDIYNSVIGIMIMRFIAFAYTYHYLNWFSKTSIIKWHKVPTSFVVTTLLLWGASVGLYVADYRLGIATLGFFSLLHVFLEFPLNYHSFLGIGKEIRNIAKTKKFSR
ncbi:hypothetical protein COU78_06275 [Candidatus Peregrinibacteria bacterium CG10_big_fil_rev_8_21_14_0_10_49_24]|nr:MAG: hypothetical protein COV83_03105 [Candidatus Peregrinibacteria bacterium CG11_big_fil_rev_8_21_14_0_20_49_14]PIR50457.1 MAG: hypothetical protein COU78_06275 [Candidatus Peregrinibacteria bacterium CG10_big_fil_rev_8_21_14_0_10_49_24]PJA68293.1 MAG: hypothetical protein CO157_00265 [Candidatus Peregrinibacteria bacterium CG_4_9_14_3_um_filter_49_12]